MAVESTTVNLRQDEGFSQKLTSWTNEPTLQQLTTDYENAKSSHGAQMAKISRWQQLLKVDGSARPKRVKGRSAVQPKLIRRQAEWRYSALTEPFLGTDKLYKVSPVTFEDAEAAKQNELVLNYQFRTKINRVKFIDDYVRATVDEGTSIIRVGWKRRTIMVKQKVPVWTYREPANEEELQATQQAFELKNLDPKQYEENIPPEIKAAIEFYEETEQISIAEQTGEEEIEVEKVIFNHPTAEVMNPDNVIIDPAAEGDINKAMFVVVSFETSKAELSKEPKRYKHLDKVQWDGGNSPMSVPDHVTTTPEQQTHDSLRQKKVAHEYWGFYNIKGGTELYPFIATWIGSTLIRMELNPFPDQKLPFVVVTYLPIKREMYGEPDAELLEDNQNVLGAVTRGMIDLMGRSANSQQGFAKGMLDPLNRRRFEQGQDYEFNPNVSPTNGHINHTYPEIPQSAMLMLNLQNQEAEALTGVKSFGGGLSGESYGDVAVGVRGAMDAASKREMAILRRLAKGIKEIGQKFIAMNSEFLSEEETVRITNTEFQKIKRTDLAGDFDLDVDISTAEIDNAKSQDLGFMLQTIGPNMDLSMTQLILSEIANLKRMPELAHKIKTFQPQPDPMEEKMKELTIKKTQLEIQELESKAALNKAKAEEAQADADLKTLQFVENQSGTAHDRDLEKQRAQSEGNQNLAVTKALVTPRKSEETDPDIEAAVGFNELSNGARTIGEGPQAMNVPAPPPELEPELGLEPGMEPGMEFDPNQLPIDPELSGVDPEQEPVQY